VVQVLIETEPRTRAELSPDTQAVLLLCSELGASGEPRPLTAAEYNRLARWLAGKRLRPSDLLTNEAFEDLAADLPSPKRLRALLERGRLLGLSVAKWLNFGIWVISRAEASYPSRLRKLDGQAPPLLFGAGSLDHLNRGGLALVGSRDADDDAVKFTRFVAQRCAEQGVQVISGGARGIDREALTTALDSGGNTVAIPVDSLLKVVAERTARDAIRDQRLTVATPYDPEMGFAVGRAMGRNKIIYALADHAVVVQFTAGKGGTWDGAVERLGHNQKGLGSVPVFVRATNEAEEGWLKLRNLGAHRFPVEEFGKGQIASVLARYVDGATGPDATEPRSEAGVPPLETDGDVGPVQPAEPAPAGCNGSERASETPELAPPHGDEADTCYHRCLALLLEELRAEPAKKELREIAARLDLVPQQFNKWLNRALKEGKAMKEKKGNKIVFVNAALAERQTLFNGGAK
jgi:predicted Rossmann fold nucleotide-binding protein DprA/Smf involved in DNA uptake